jgi:hypothetical protein
MLVRQVFCLSHILIPFALVIFWIESLVFVLDQPWSVILPFPPSL